MKSDEDVKKIIDRRLSDDNAVRDEKDRAHRTRVLAQSATREDLLIVMERSSTQNKYRRLAKKWGL